MIAIAKVSFCLFVVGYQNNELKQITIFQDCTMAWGHSSSFGEDMLWKYNDEEFNVEIYVTV